MSEHGQLVLWNVLFLSACALIAAAFIGCVTVTGKANPPLPFAEYECD